MSSTPPCFWKGCAWPVRQDRPFRLDVDGRQSIHLNKADRAVLFVSLLAGDFYLLVKGASLVVGVGVGSQRLVGRRLSGKTSLPSLLSSFSPFLFPFSVTRIFEADSRLAAGRSRTHLKKRAHQTRFQPEFVDRRREGEANEERTGRPRGYLDSAEPAWIWSRVRTAPKKGVAAQRHQLDRTC